VPLVIVKSHTVSDIAHVINNGSYIEK